MTDQTSRTGVLIHKNLHYKRRRDLERPGLSTVWIQLRYPGRKPVFIQALYRQHQRLGREGTKAISSQQKRCSQLLDIWEQVSKDNVEIITMGDFNLNGLTFETPEDKKTGQDKTQAKMTRMLKDKILNNGFTLIGNQPTRTKDRPDSRPAALDLIMTNRRDKVESFEIGLSSFSDHLVQTLTRRTKKIVVTQSRIKIRSFKNYSKQQYRDNIINHFKYIESLYESDPKTITGNIQEIICDSPRETAPLKMIQVDNKNSIKLSEESRIMLARRDAALDEMKTNPSIENIRDYKFLRNETNQTIAKEKWKRKSTNLQAEALSNNDKWKVAKKLTGQKKFNSPQLIIEGAKHHMSPKDMAAGLNRLYIKKFGR